jgi:hypothetical protein
MNCENCKWWVKGNPYIRLDVNKNSVNGYSGDCVRRAPELRAGETHKFPQMTDFSFCGDWEEKI